MTPLQSKVLATWESLHPEFQIIPDPAHSPSRFAPWRYLIIQRRSQEPIGSVTRYTQEMSDPRYEPIVSRLRNSLKHGHVPKLPAPKIAPPRDPISGQILPRQKTPKPHHPQPPPTPIIVAPGSGYPPPVPKTKPIKMTSKATMLWKYGPHGPPHPPSTPLLTFPRIRQRLRKH